MRYGILGPVCLFVEGGQAGGVRPREQRVLAALLLDANRVVTTSRLLDVLWDENMPSTARTQIRNIIAALRQNLGATNGQTPITRVGGGYIIEVGEGELDLHVFEAHVRQAQRLIDAGQLTQAYDSLCAALALWRGPALGGIGESALNAHASRLEEQRLACLEQRIELDLALGRHRSVVGELKVLITEYPLREGLVELGMIALHLCGRRQDALNAFAAAREYLNEHAGLDPRRELIELQQAILRGGPLPGYARYQRATQPRRISGQSLLDDQVTGRETERLRAENAFLRAELNRIRSNGGGNVRQAQHR